MDLEAVLVFAPVTRTYQMPITLINVHCVYIWGFWPVQEATLFGIDNLQPKWWNLSPSVSTKSRIRVQGSIPPAWSELGIEWFWIQCRLICSLAASIWLSFQFDLSPGNCACEDTTYVVRFVDVEQGSDHCWQESDIRWLSWWPCAIVWELQSPMNNMWPWLFLLLPWP